MIKSFKIYYYDEIPTSQIESKNIYFFLDWDVQTGLQVKLK